MYNYLGTERTLYKSDTNLKIQSSKCRCTVLCHQDGIGNAIIITSVLFIFFSIYPSVAVVTGKMTTLNRFLGESVQFS